MDFDTPFMEDGPRFPEMPISVHTGGTWLTWYSPSPEFHYTVDLNPNRWMNSDHQMDYRIIVREAPEDPVMLTMYMSKIETIKFVRVYAHTNLKHAKDMVDKVC